MGDSRTSWRGTVGGSMRRRGRRQGHGRSGLGAARRPLTVVRRGRRPRANRRRAGSAKGLQTVIWALALVAIAQMRTGVVVEVQPLVQVSLQLGHAGVKRFAKLEGEEL